MRDLFQPSSVLSSFAALAGGNAVLSREMRVALRNERAFALMAVYVAVLGAVIAYYFPADAAIAVDSVRPGAGAQGRDLFLVFLKAQAAMVVLLLPALAAGTLTQERERQTLEPLLLSPLTPLQIVWGKGVGVLMFGALLLTATIPVTSLCFLLGGVSPGQFVSAYAVLLGLAAFVTGFGLYCSARWHSSTQATLACYALLPFALALLVVFMGPGAIVAGLLLLGAAFLKISGLRARWKETRLAKRLGIIYDIFFGLMMIALFGFVVRILAGSYGMGFDIFMLVFVTPYLLFVARLGLERTGEELAKRPQARRPTPERIQDIKAEWERAVAPPPVVYLPSPTGRYTYSSQTPAPAVAPPGKPTYGVRPFLSDKMNPIFAKDLRAGLLGKWSYLGRFSYVVVIGSELLLLMLCLSNFASSIWARPEQGTQIFAGWANFHLALLMMAGAIFGARSLAPEREQQTLPHLLTAPIPALSIVTGKVMAVAVYTFYVFVMGAPMTLLLCGVGLISLRTAAVFLALELVLGALAAAWGVHSSMAGVTVRRALGLALGGLAVLFFSNMIFSAMAPSFLFNSGGSVTGDAVRSLFALANHVLPFSVMAQAVTHASSSGRTLLSLAVFAILAAFLIFKTALDFRRYAQTV